jgi:hypothetical protein
LDRRDKSHQIRATGGQDSFGQGGDAERGGRLERSQPPWSPEIGTYLFPIDVYYLVQSETPGQLESTVQGKARDFLNQAIAARNRWAGVPEMHSWRLVGSETEHKRADAWRASGWASARIALEVQLDYEK